MSAYVIEHLAQHPECLPVLAQWFKTEWPDWYGPSGPGNADEDLSAFSQRDRLPLGVVAFRDGVVCGVAALKGESLPSHAHLKPWAAAGYVVPPLRGQGIGAMLLSALEVEARALGYTRIYCGTSSAAALLMRSQWRFIEAVDRQGKVVGIYEKPL